MLGLLAQIKTFFLTLLLGMIAGIIFHYYQLTIRELRAGKFSLYLLDVFLWILMILLISLGMLLITQGELRIYFFLILLAGSLLYFKWLARKLENTLEILAQAGAGLLRFTGRSFAMPIEWLLRGIKSLWRRWHFHPPPENTDE